MKALLLCLTLTMPAQAQTRIGADGNVTLDVAAVAEETVRLFSDGGADAGILFAMYADALRNIRANPGDALRLADEGLGLIRGAGPRTRVRR